MTRRRLRETYSPEQLAELYKTPHQHGQWADHRLRVAVTVAMASWFGRVESVADLSCGDGAIIDAIDARWKYKGDLAPVPSYDFVGPIEQTIEEINPVELFVLSETIEHLDDPDSALRAIRAKTAKLILSTPNDEATDGNPEHYWAWSKDDMREMLVAAGFNPIFWNIFAFDGSGYGYQIWLCE